MSDYTPEELEAAVWADVYTGLLKEANKLEAAKELGAKVMRSISEKAQAAKHQAGRLKDKAVQSKGQGKTRHMNMRAQDPGPGAPREMKGGTKLDQVGMADKKMSDAMTPKKLEGPVKEHFKAHWKKYVAGGTGAAALGGGAAAYKKMKKKK